MKKILFTTIIMLLVPSLGQADVMSDVYQLQTQWAAATYTEKDKAQKEAFEVLIIKADGVVDTYPQSAEAWIWSGIIKSTYAGVKGGLGALSLAKEAKSDLEKAMELNDKALAGSAYASLGTLYFNVPGWPIGFGDDDKAETLLSEALVINPNGIDSNYFYAQFLVNQKQPKQAKEYYLKAQQAPARPSRPLADQGRQQEIKVALDKLKDK